MPRHKGPPKGRRVSTISCNPCTWGTSLIRRHEGRWWRIVQRILLPCISVLEQVRSYLRIIDPEIGEDELLKSVALRTRHTMEPLAWHWSHWPGGLVNRVRGKCLFSVAGEPARQRARSRFV